MLDDSSAAGCGFNLSMMMGGMEDALRMICLIIANGHRAVFIDRGNAI